MLSIPYLLRAVMHDKCFRGNSSRWFLEEESRSTRENALFSIRMITQHRYRHT